MSRIIICCILLLISHHPTNGVPIIDSISIRNVARFSWASLGDSWASGVSWHSNSTDYDGDKNNCHRWKESYGPLMEADASWTISPQQFHFAACSGARLGNIVGGQQGENPPQMQLVGDRPQLITYHAGGNDCGFGGVIHDCIYPSPRFTFKDKLPYLEYPPPYPEPGLCTDGVQRANDYINRPGTKAPMGLYGDELLTVQELLQNNTVKDNPDFRLYILGYAHFFNTADNFCSKLSFAPLSGYRGNPPNLSVRLRTDINDAVERVNLILRRVAKDVKDARVRFVDVTSVFNGHRFCEDAHNTKKGDQWYNKDVWLWNLVPPYVDESTDPADKDRWIDGTMLPNGKTWDGTEIYDDAMGGTGWKERPFHPKQGGSVAIKDFIIAQAKSDKIVGVVGSVVPGDKSNDPKSVVTCACNENRCEGPLCCGSGSCLAKIIWKNLPP